MQVESCKNIVRVRSTRTRTNRLRVIAPRTHIHLHQQRLNSIARALVQTKSSVFLSWACMAANVLPLVSGSHSKQLIMDVKLNTDDIR